jgi:phosphomannomutase
VADYAKIFKAYDIRGIVPDELDDAAAEAIGAAFVQVTGARSVVTMHDMRTSSAPLAAAFGRGATAQGADVIMGGLGSSDMLYFASGSLQVAGAMITASHNPARYNGLKMCTEGAKPVGEQAGLIKIRDLAASGPAVYEGTPGRVTERNLLPEYAAFLRSLVDLSAIRPLKVAVDAGNGMAGHTVPAVFGGLPIEIIPLFFELDGTFPNHEPNPIEPANMADLQRGGQQRGRHRAGLRRRRRPLLRGRRAGPDRVAVRARRADRRARAGPGAGRTGHPQPDHLPRGAGDHHRARRRAGPHPGRPLVHQGPDGGQQRDLRR